MKLIIAILQVQETTVLDINVICDREGFPSPIQLIISAIKVIITEICKAKKYFEPIFLLEYSQMQVERISKVIIKAKELRAMLM